MICMQFIVKRHVVSILVLFHEHENSSLKSSQSQLLPRKFCSRRARISIAMYKTEFAVLQAFFEKVATSTFFCVSTSPAPCLATAKYHSFRSYFQMWECKGRAKEVSLPD